MTVKAVPPPAAVGTSQGNKTNEDEELEMEAATPSNVQKAVTVERVQAMIDLSLIHISEPTRP